MYYSQLYGTAKEAWSCKLDPTPGRFDITGIFRESSSGFGPIPDSCRSWGVCKAPAATMTSLEAFTLDEAPPADGE